MSEEFATELLARDPQIAALSARVSGVEAIASALAVTTDDECLIASSNLAEVAQVRKGAEARRKHIVGPQNEAIRRINDFFHQLVDPLERAEATLKTKILAYRRVQEEAAAIERRQAEEERRRAAEAEFARLRALEDARLVAEAAERARREAQAEPMASQAEKAAAVAAERAATLALAVETKAAQQATLARVVIAPAREIAKTIATRAGSVTARKVWRFEIVEPMRVPHEYWVVDEKRIGEAVRAGVREIPGVRIYEDELLAVGGGGGR